MIFNELETKRLRLKNIGTEDVEFMYQQFSNDYVNEHLYDMEPLSSIDEAEGIVRFYCNSVPKLQHRWILIRKEDGVKMGTCGFHCWNKETKTVEIGYDLQKEYTGQGYMSEAMELVLKFVKDEMGVERIDANIYVDNQASIALVRRFGFTKTGEKFEYLYGKDYLHDIYSIAL